MFTSILVICIFGLSSSLAQIPSIREGCPDPTVVQNFNVTAYLGKWYEQEKYPLIFEAGGRCITADYSLKDDGNVKVFNRMLVGTIPSSIEGFAKLNSTNGEAKLAVTFNVPIAVTSPYWVLETDYSSYSVVWSCANVFGISATPDESFLMIKVAFLIGLIPSASGSKESMKMWAELPKKPKGDVAVKMDGKDVSFSF